MFAQTFWAKMKLTNRVVPITFLHKTLENGLIDKALAVMQ